MKYISCVFAIAMLVIASPLFASNVYKEGWTYSTLAKMKLSCVKGLSISELFAVGGSSDNAEGKITLTQSEKNQEINQFMNDVFSFCNCTWDKLASDYSIDEFSNQSKGQTPEQMSNFIYGKYAAKGCKSPL